MTGAGRTGSASRGMRAAVLRAPNGFDVAEVPVPEPGPGHVRVRLEGCGVCASNLPPWEGRPWFQYPFQPGQPGHEGWGRVDAVGPGVQTLRPGQRVAFLSDHAYAEYDVAPAACVVPLPEALRDRPFPGEPLGCAVNVFRKSGIRKNRIVAVIGVGFLGALLVQMCSRAGALVIGISRRPSALAHAWRCGARHTVRLEEPWQVVEAVRKITGGQFCDVVIEAVGKQQGLDVAGEIVREGGRLVIAGYHQDGLRQINLQQWNWRALDIVNAHDRDTRVYVDGMRRAAEAAAEGMLDPWGIITHRYPLQQLNEALAHVAERPDDFLKGVIVFGDGATEAGEAPCVF